MLSKTMRVIVESFVVMANLFVLIMQIISLAKNALRTPFSTRIQRTLQLLFLLSILFLMACQFKLLKTRYSHQVWDFDNTEVMGKIKLLQYIAENLLRAVVLLSLSTILSSTDRMKVRGIKDNAAFQVSILAYNLARSVPITVIFVSFANDVPFESFLMELFLIGEGAAAFLIYISLRGSLENVQKELGSSFLPERSYLEYLLSQYRLYTSMIAGSLVAEIVARVTFLFVMIEHQSRALVFLWDAGNLLKIISIYVLVKALNDLVFIDYSQDTLLYSKGNANQSQERFFVFEEDPGEKVLELGKE